MNLVILNKSLDPVYIVDIYESFIWTDRYNEHGDFELYTSFEKDLLNRLQKDYYIQNLDSDHVMIIEDLVIKTDSEDGAHLALTGRSLESILCRRIVWKQTTINGKLQNGIETLLNECIINPEDENRKINNFVFEASTDPRITEPAINAQYTGDNLYDVISAICKEHDIGFKVTLNDDKQFVFKLYAGVNRSYDQESFTPVNVLSGLSLTYEKGHFWGADGTTLSNDFVRNYTAINPLIDVIAGVTYRIPKYQGSAVLYDENNTKVGQIDHIGFDPLEDFEFVIPDGAVKVGLAYMHTDMSEPKEMFRVTPYESDDKKVNSYVIFSPNFENLLNSNYAESKSSLKNVTLVGGEGQGSERKYVTVGEATGLDRRELFTNASDISSDVNGSTLSESAYEEQLTQRGKEKLEEHKETTSFEGEAETTFMFKYGIDFFNGDIVQVENEYGHASAARVVEVVMSEDSSGFSVYPTFKYKEKGE